MIYKAIMPGRQRLPGCEPRNGMKSLSIIVLLIGWLVAGAPAQASDPNDRLSEQWNRLLRGCDETEARREFSRLRPQVARSQEYNLARDIFLKHGCSEAKLRDAIARDNQERAAIERDVPRPGCLILARRLAREIDAENPNADAVVKGRVLDHRLAISGCLSKFRY